MPPPAPDFLSIRVSVWNWPLTRSATNNNSESYFSKLLKDFAPSTSRGVQDFFNPLATQRHVCIVEVHASDVSRNNPKHMYTRDFFKEFRVRFVLYENISE